MKIIQTIQSLRPLLSIIYRASDHYCQLSRASDHYCQLSHTEPQTIIVNYLISFKKISQCKVELLCDIFRTDGRMDNSIPLYVLSTN